MIWFSLIFRREFIFTGGVGKKSFLQFKTVRRVINIPQEGFRYIESKSYYELLFFQIPEKPDFYDIIFNNNAGYPQTNYRK